MERTYCAIDFETACNHRASACAIGAARIRNGTVGESFYSLIKPPKGMEILPFFTSIHGISMDQVDRAPTFAELWPALKAFLGNDILIAHNAAFDSGVFQAVLMHYEIPDRLPLFECTLNMARRRWPELANHRLDTLCEYLGIELDHHEALSDAIGCAKIFLASSL